MKIKIDEAEGDVLDYITTSLATEYGAIYECGAVFARTESGNRGRRFNPSSNWEHGGPIIAREGISIRQSIGHPVLAFLWRKDATWDFKAYGPTPLIAAMRCFVKSQIGEETVIAANIL